MKHAEVKHSKEELVEKIMLLEEEQVSTFNELRKGPAPQIAARHESRLDHLKHEMKTLRSEIDKLDYAEHVKKELADKEESQWRLECLARATTPQLRGTLAQLERDCVGRCTPTELKSELHRRGEKLT